MELLRTSARAREREREREKKGCFLQTCRERDSYLCGVCRGDSLTSLVNQMSITTDFHPMPSRRIQHCLKYAVLPT